MGFDEPPEPHCQCCAGFEQEFFERKALAKAQSALIAELVEALEDLPVEGYADMPDAKVRDIAAGVSRPSRPGARSELNRRALLAKAKEAQA